MARDRFGFLERHGASSLSVVRWRIRSLVALRPAWDLLLFAKHLFFAAMVTLRANERQEHSAA
jgi:hypothetical protein